MIQPRDGLKPLRGLAGASVAMYSSLVSTMGIKLRCSILVTFLSVAAVSTSMLKPFLAHLLDDRLSLDTTLYCPDFGMHVPLSSLHDCHHHRHHTRAICKGNFCSCGKCGFAAIFQHSCPLAYHPQSLNCTSTVIYSTSDLVNNINLLLNEDLGSTKEALFTTERQIYLLMLLQASRCDKNVCLLSVRAHPCTSVVDDCIVEDYLHSDSNTTLSVTATFNKEKKELRSWLVRKPNRFKEQLQQPWQVIKRNVYISSRHRDHCNKIETCRYVTDAVNLAMLLLLLSGDVELNPGPGNPKTFRRLVKQLSDKLERQGLDTQRAIVKSSYMSLFPEARTMNGGWTLEAFYDDLLTSLKYGSHSECILCFVADELSLTLNKDGGQADEQFQDILESRELKFIKLLVIFLSYETKESLTEAKILPYSAISRKEDASELICELIMKGVLSPAIASLNELLKHVNKDEYKLKIKEVLKCPEWASTKFLPQPTTSSLKTPFGGKSVKADSPLTVSRTPSSELPEGQPHGSNWTAPVKPTYQPPTVSGDKSPSFPTIRELATFPLLEDAWEDLGRALSIDDQTLQSINKKFTTPIKKQKELFRTYLRNCLHPTWDDIIRALIKIGKLHIAENVVETLQLPQELLTTAKKSLKPVKLSTKSTTNLVVELDAPLVPAKISKTELHDKYDPSVSDESGIFSSVSSSKHQVVSDVGSPSSSQSFSYSDSSAVKVTAQISHLDTNDRDEVDYSNPLMINREKSLTAQLPLKPKSDVAADDNEESNHSSLSMIKSKTDHVLPDKAKPYLLTAHSSPTPSQIFQWSDPSNSTAVDKLRSRSLTPIRPKITLATDNVGSPSKNKQQSLNCDSLTVNKDQQKPAQEPVESTQAKPIDGASHSKTEDKSCEDKDKRSDSLSSDEFHSAGELPLDESHGCDTLHQAVLKQNVERVVYCVTENTAILNKPLQDESGQTGLHLAAKLGYKDIVRVLLHHKASVNVIDSNGCTPLYLAASNGNYEVARMIIASPDCTVHTLSKDGTPLLLDPASKGFSMICELLLENRADPLAESRAGVSPLYIASCNGHKDVVKVLLKFGADPTRICRETSKTPLQEAIDHEYVEVTKLLMKSLSEINKKNEALFDCKTAENVQELIKTGVNVDTKKANGSTPLIIHSAAGNKEVVQELIAQKANVDLQDNEGWSALMAASRNGNLEIVQTLIFAGAIPDLKNKEGLTALMCATFSGHVKVVKELLLAKADPGLRRKDGKSALEIAEQRGNQELITALKRHTTTVSSGADPLYGLLGNYLKLKEDIGSGKQASRRQQLPVSARRNGASSLLLPKPPLAQVDEASTVKQELEKCYKKIADLETRIHDLTLQTTAEIPKDTDLSYLERKRLEDEFRKLKELKHKAEQYAIEAKQTSQRLSAENSKLKEDLNRERHHNEVTRNNIIREFEEKVSFVAMADERKAIEMEVSDQEVKEKAHRLLHVTPRGQVDVKRVELTAMEIKESILNHSVSVNTLQLAVTGLASSGKSELLRQIINLKHATFEVRIGVKSQTSSNEINEVILCYNNVLRSHALIRSTTDDAGIQTVSVALAQSLLRRHDIPTFASNDSSLVHSNGILFSDPNLNEHFRALFSHLQKFMIQVESNGSADMLKTCSVSFINLANTGVGIIAHAVFCALASHCKNILLLNLLNLERDTPDSFTLFPYFADSNDGIKPTNMNKFQSALQSLKTTTYVASKVCQKPRILLVGTHEDKLSERKFVETKNYVEHVMMDFAESTGVADAICPGMECINTTNADDCKRVQNRIVQFLSNKQSDFECDIPLKYLFLLSHLQGMKQMFISQRKLQEEAQKCGITSEYEIEHFLFIFNNCGSIYYSSDGEIPILKDFILLDPFHFIKAVDKLHDITTMSFTDNQELFEDVQQTKLGFISKNLASYLWPGDGEGRVTQAQFILGALKELKFLVSATDLQFDSDNIMIERGKTCYFMPMLRPDFDTAEPQGDCNSLFVTYNVTMLPFQFSTDVLLHVQNYFGSSITFDPNPFYNTLCFKWHDAQEQRNANVIIRFLQTEQIEISVKFLNQAPRMSTVTRLFSQLKTAFIQLFHRLSALIDEHSYDLAIVCPHSSENSSHTHNIAPPTSLNKVHFVTFGSLSSADEMLFCQTCKEFVPSDRFPWARLLWTQVAYCEPSIVTVNHRGYLTPKNIANIAHNLTSHHCHEALYNFAEQLGLSREKIHEKQLLKSMEDLLYEVIFTWTSKSPSNSVKALAKILHSCGLFQEAVRLNPVLLDKSNTLKCHHSLTYRELSSVATHLVPTSTFKQLVQAHDITPQPSNSTSSLTSRSEHFESLKLLNTVEEKETSGKKEEGRKDRILTRERMVHRLKELQYNRLAAALEAGTIEKLDQAL